MYKLKSNINELREEIQHKDKCLRVKTKELVNEQEKNVALMFSKCYCMYDILIVMVVQVSCLFIC